MNKQHQFYPRQIFRAYDFRGKVSFLKSHVVTAIANGLAKQFIEYGQDTLVLGYDARLTSPIYAQILKSVLQANKINVIEIGCCSTPQMYFAAREVGGNGIMVTASHNPKDDNGIKWILNAEPPTPEMIQAVGDFAELEFYKNNQKKDKFILNEFILVQSLIFYLFVIIFCYFKILLMLI